MQVETVLRVYRRQPHWSIPAVVIAFFAAIATFLILNSLLMGWVILVFAAVFTFALKRDRSEDHNRLRLTSDGMELRLPFRAYSASWNEVGEFGVLPFGSRKYVVFDLSQSYVNRQGLITKWLAQLLGRKGSVPGVHGCSQQELADILNSWRYKHTSER